MKYTKQPPNKTYASEEEASVAAKKEKEKNPVVLTVGETKILVETINLLSKMILCGEKHTDISLAFVKESREVLKNGSD